MLQQRRSFGLAPGLTARSALDKFAAVQMIDVHLPTTDGREILLTRYTHPEPELQLVIDRLKLRLPPQPPPRITTAAVNQAATVVKTFRLNPLIYNEGVSSKPANPRRRASQPRPPHAVSYPHRELVVQAGPRHLRFVATDVATKRRLWAALFDGHRGSPGDGSLIVLRALQHAETSSDGTISETSIFSAI